MSATDTCTELDENDIAIESGIRPRLMPPASTRSPLPTLETLPRVTRVLHDVWDEAYARAPTQPAWEVGPLPSSRSHVAPLAGTRYRKARARRAWPHRLRAFVVTVAIANVLLVYWIVARDFERLFVAW